MSHWLDESAKRLAEGRIGRRRLLAGGGAAAGALMFALSPGAALAGKKSSASTCIDGTCGSHCCNSGETCCSDSNGKERTCCKHDQTCLSNGNCN